MSGMRAKAAGPLTPKVRHRSSDGSCPKAAIVRRAAIDRVWDKPAVREHKSEWQVSDKSVID